MTPVLDVPLHELEEDPYPFLSQLRSQAPVAFVPSLGLWLLTRFDDVKMAHRDLDRFVTAGPSSLSECFGEHHILNVDGDHHARYRRGVDATLAPRVVSDRFMGIIAAVVDAQLALIVGRGRGDLVSEYFEPISVVALSWVLGVPEIDADVLRGWFKGLIAGGSNIGDDPEVAAYAAGVSSEIDRRLAPVMERKDAEPDDSVISNLLQTARGATLAERVADITPTLKILVSGGLQEPGHTAATTAAAVLGDEELRRRFATDPADLARAAIEEAIRWVAPIGQNTRRTCRPVTLHGVSIPEGVDVGLSVASANRDERVFGPDADRFDISRSGHSHVGFGFGTHFCPGNFFGRVVARVAVTRLFEELPDISLVSAPRFRGYVFRAPVELNCEWAARP